VIDLLKMKENIDIIVDKVLASMQGAKRAKPSKLLWQKIVQKLPQDSIGKLSNQQIKWFAVAASLLVFINIFAFQIFTNNSTNSFNKLESQYDNQVFTTYNLY
jgi:hypothetical protein